MYFTYFGYDITFLPDVQALNLNFHIASCQANDEPQLIRYLLRHLTLSPQSITATMIPILYLLTDSQSTQALTSVVQRDVVHPHQGQPRHRLARDVGSKKHLGQSAITCRNFRTRKPTDYCQLAREAAAEGSHGRVRAAEF